MSITTYKSHVFLVQAIETDLAQNQKIQLTLDNESDTAFNETTSMY